MTFRVLLVVALLLGPLLAHAEEDKSGLKANTLSLPAGPGSLEGLGENVDLSLNMGTASYAVPIPLPKGYATLSPSLVLRYSSGAGASSVGLGWSLGEPFIERMTARGLPRYTSSDAFVTHSGDELVRIPGTSTFRARYEGAFVRYTWLNEGNGKEGAWRAEYPDGTVGYFGAISDGAEVATARLGDGATGVFRYYLVEKKDALGHRIRYDYTQVVDCLPADDLTPTAHVCEPVLTSITWVFAGGTPRYKAVLAYEDREDKLSDCKPGFDVRQGQRLASVTVRVRGVQQRKVVLTYEPYETTGGLSRLRRVTTYGLDGSTKSPVELSFAYTDSGAVPFVESIGSVAVDFRTGTTDFVDLNADGLPDVVDTSGMHHLVHLSNMTTSTHVLAAPVETTHDGSMKLASSSVQMADLDGDGRSDMVDALTGNVLWNRGVGDWQLDEFAATGMPDPGTDANLRLFDYDGDKKIDLLSNQGDSCAIYRSDGTGAFGAALDACEAPGAGATFVSGIQLADINGDGLQDLAQYLSTGELRYRLYLGYGRWLPWKTMFGLPAYLPTSAVHLVDINGDALADVVKVEGASSANEIALYINRGGTSFFSTSVSAVPGNGSVPSSSDASIRFADMNGNGSTDIVWIENPSGTITYLDLYPQRAGLLSRIENGIGQVIAVTYGSSVVHMAEDGGPSAWTDRLPSPMLTVDVIERWAMGGGGVQARTLHYSDGYYDANEKQFRGFRRVEEHLAGDSHTEAGRIVHVFDVGKSDRYRKGLVLEEQTYSDERYLSDVVSTYDDCAVTGVPTAGLDKPVRYVCLVASETTLYEGLGPSESVTTREAYEHDGYGNQIKGTKLGVVARGGIDCGAACTGDEIYEETAFVTPTNTAGRWLLRAPYRKRVYGKPGGETAETLTYYDGEPFIGLPVGTLTVGLATRVTDKVHTDSAQLVDSARQRHDAHGNVVELVDANGHRRLVTYDSDGVLALSEEVVLDDAGHATYGLRESVTYHEIFELPSTSTAWQRVEGGTPVSDAHVTAYEYDALGRLAAIAKPGDSLATPTQSFEYLLGSPRSSIVTRARSVAGSTAFDLETTKCFDGLGRSTQSITRTGVGVYQASGYEVFSVQGEASLSYQPYSMTALACATVEPTGILKAQTYRDATKRVTSMLAPDATLYGSPSHTRTDYLPLLTRAHDALDLDPTSEHFGTPTTTRTDGLGRTIAIERLLATGDEPVMMTVGYDELGRIDSIADDAGNIRTTSYDLLGRIESVEDPDAGHLGFTYDAAGNALTRTDARGVTIAMRYDEANRLVAEWDEASPDATRVSYEYDAAPGCAACTSTEGQLARTRYPLAGVFDALVWGEDTFGFDARGRATHSGREIRGTLFRTEVRYDNADRVAAVTYPDGRTIESMLDGAGRVIAVPGYADSVSYTERGQEDELLLHNRTLTTHGYDDVMRLANLETRTQEGALVLGYEYERDRVGNVLAVDDTLAASTTTSSAQATYGYDGFYRLTSAVLDAGRSAHETVSIAYDRIDNIVSMTSDLGASSKAHVGTYRYDASRPHAVAQAGSRAYGYDAAGNVTTRGVQALSWDHAGRLARVTSNNSTLARYAYGIDRERVVKREGKSFTYYVGPDFEVRNGVATTWVRVSGARVAKIQDPSLAAAMLPDLAPAFGADGVINVADAHAAVVAGEDAETVEMLLVASAMAALVGPEGLVTYVHQNHLGSSAVTTDETGAVVQRTESYPYGEVRYQSDYLEDYSWTGQERDLAAGLSYHSARYLDTWAGRWLAADPLFLGDLSVSLKRPMEVNLYSYAGNNPLLNRDPTGLAWDSQGNEFEGPANPISPMEFETREQYVRAHDTPIQSTEGPIDVVVGAAGAAKTGLVVTRGVFSAIKAAAQQGGNTAARNLAGAVKCFVKGLFGRGNAAPKEGDKVYRVWGDGAGPGGRSWTRTDPSTVPGYRDAAGLPKQNSGRFVSEGRLRNVEGVETRDALPLDGNTGGLDELVVPNPARQIEVERVSGVNPEF